jgi:transcriptional regulator with XRE-family HTH domain
MHAATPARAIGRASVTAPIPRQTGQGVSDAERFRLYIRHLMDENGFETFEALAQAGGFDASTLSRWFSSTNGPSVSLLHKIKGPLRVRLGDLMVAAGLASREDLGMVAEPMPAEMRDFMAMLRGAPEDDRRALLGQLRALQRLYRTIRPESRVGRAKVGTR